MSAGLSPASPHDPLLVVVDMQRVFAEPGSPWHTPGFDRIVEPIDRLVRAFGERVAFTRFLVPPEPEGSWADYYRTWDFILDPGAAPLLDLIEPWAGTPNPRVEKPRFSKWGPELRELAGPSGTLVVCGVATDCCVVATVLDAVDDGIHVRVVADACAGVDADAHERALAVMAGFSPQVAITSVEQEIAVRARTFRTSVG